MQSDFEDILREMKRKISSLEERLDQQEKNNDNLLIIIANLTTASRATVNLIGELAPKGVVSTSLFNIHLADIKEDLDIIFDDLLAHGGTDEVGANE